MSFEFISPEGVAIRCETVEELVASYTALWRNHQHTSMPPIDNRLSAQHQNKLTLGRLVKLPPLEIEDPVVDEFDKLHMPQHWIAVWVAILDHGRRGVTVIEVSEDIDRNRHTVSSIVKMMHNNGFVENFHSRWRVPASLKAHKPVPSRAAIPEKPTKNTPTG